MQKKNLTKFNINLWLKKLIKVGTEVMYFSIIKVTYNKATANAKDPIVWPSDVKCWLIRKDPGAVKDWRQEKGTTVDMLVTWHHWLDGHEFEQAAGDGEGQGSLPSCSPWSHKDWVSNNKTNGKPTANISYHHFSSVGLLTSCCCC